LLPTNPVLLALISLSLCACAGTVQVPEGIEAVLLGEQHDARPHQQIHREVIESLARQQRLAAVTLEMAEQGASTAGLPRDAAEAAVQSALRWNDEAWPWKAYGPAVMAAVRAGVPVVGANLPRAQMRSAMSDAALDALLAGPVLQAQHRAIRTGHCGLLPESQVAPMTRIQVARDRAMAQAVAGAAVAGKTVVLLAGGGHVDPALGVPLHLPPSLRVQATLLPDEPPAQDYCAQLRQRMRTAPDATIKR
jgi:uncharacterized iron-regulated protein